MLVNRKRNKGFLKSSHTLEFDKVLLLLSECAKTEGAKKAALNTCAEKDAEVVKRMQRETSAAVQLIAEKGSPSFGGVKDITDSLERAGKKQSLHARELIDIADVLRTARLLIEYIKDEQNAVSIYFHRLSLNKFLEEKISAALPSEDMVSDEASPDLADLRRKIRNAQVNVRETLQKFLTGSYGKYLQESIVTVRGGRYVIPVKTEHKNEIKGLLHDTSATGATVFIEPYSVVEANNELKELEIKEIREIERILYELSADCAAFSNTIFLNYVNITQIAYIFAKAELSLRLDASEPLIVEDRIISYVMARHPLLDKDKVVAIDIKLGGEYDTLVITGPNTGGKTVSLKTLGLFSLMAQSGLHLPCKEAKVCIFDEVLADIGDEQSIQQSLSTFSSHMVNIIDILGCISNRSLVLFDELGAGTDPVEGAALAIALLEEVRSYNALCAATTHYSELKEYAVNRQGVMNAGCEFDIETLKPTYRLIIGTPGRSNAFAISERLGLSRKIIEKAERQVSAENRRLEEVIAGLDRQRVELERKKEELDLKEKNFLEYEDKKKRDIEQLSERAHRDMKTLRERSVAIIESAKASSAFVFDKLQKIQKKNERELTRKEIELARNEIRESIRGAENNYSEQTDVNSEDYQLPRALKVGDEVLVYNVGKSGILEKTADKDGNVTVKMGIITMRTSEKNLRLIAPPPKKTKSPKGAVSKTLATGTFKSEIDLRGMSGDEAWFAVDKYLDEAFLAGVFTVTLLHGKGTGALRNALWRMLKSEKRVESFRAGMYGEGDYGVTVVTIKH